MTSSHWAKPSVSRTSIPSLTLGLVAQLHGFIGSGHLYHTLGSLALISLGVSLHLEGLLQMT